MPSALFSPITLHGITFDNRVVVSPMCQYSSVDGLANDWHVQHLGHLAMSGAGLVVIEATGVERDGRITHGCLGLWSDAHEKALEPAVATVRRWGQAKLGIQLAHAGRKGSSQVPWEGGRALGPSEKPWITDSASALPFGEGWHTPRALDQAGIDRIKTAFVDAAKRSARLGLDVVELHSAHGYLLHQFFSPLSNRRTDRYGGSLENRMRLGLEIAEAVRAVFPAVLGARITGGDWAEGGATVEDAVVFAKELKARGLDYVDVSSGGLVATQKIQIGPGYQVPFAAEVRAKSGMPTRAVGMIVEPAQAEEIVASGKADMVALARGILDDPRWAWHAADALGAAVKVPPQYGRARPDTWPGAKLIRKVA
jgi:2,4-dienoyl-CoA reductase-like NADH-dependent reductase (Old Yellow Enzyme family)